MVAVYAIPHVDSRAISRVAHALKRHAPDEVWFTADVRQAHVVVLHVIGRLDAAMRDAAEARARGQRVVVIQYVLRSSQKPHTSSWVPLWDLADVVWTYYPLREWIAEDGVAYDFGDRLYESPLGVDPEFRLALPPERERLWALGTTGPAWTQESVRECHRAALVAKQRAWHLYDHSLRRPEIVQFSRLSDDDLAALYRETRYVSGLRRTEGFELPCAEGLVCGARPILFDRPHYRRWFGDWAVYIPELDRDQVQRDVTAVLRKRPWVPVRTFERRAALAMFDWGRILAPLWQRVLHQACCTEAKAMIERSKEAANDDTDSERD